MRTPKFSIPARRFLNASSNKFEQMWTILRGKIVPKQFGRIFKMQELEGIFRILISHEGLARFSLYSSASQDPRLDREGIEESWVHRER